jgi:tight adherence protein B
VTAATAIVAAYGTHLLYTAVAFGWSGLRAGPRARRRRHRPRSARAWLAQAGIEGVRPVEFGGAVVLLALVCGAVAYAVFGAVVPALAAAAFAASAPPAAYRRRRRTRRTGAQEAWPRLIEEIRILTGSVGRSIPHALFEAGGRGPIELRPAFEAAQREWALSTDFERTVAVLKDRLADPTADAACETLLVAHDLGGSDLDRRLEALVEDRIQDVQGRKDALAKQAGVRFARRFVLLVPAGMALAGMTVGNGRRAYASPGGQVAVVAAIAMVILCWAWAGRIMRLPEPERVLG